MRILLALAFSMALTGPPAWADHKPNHPAPVRVQTVSRDPCAISYSPHEIPARRAAAERCRALLEQVASAPGDAALRARCERATRALSGSPCIPPGHRR